MSPLESVERVNTLAKSLRACFSGVSFFGVFFFPAGAGPTGSAPTGVIPSGRLLTTGSFLGSPRNSAIRFSSVMVSLPLRLAFALLYIAFISSCEVFLAVVGCGVFALGCAGLSAVRRVSVNFALRVLSSSANSFGSSPWNSCIFSS